MFPKRGAIALVTTALALVLLFQFKTPIVASADTVVQTDGSTSSSSTSSSPTTSGSTTATTVTGSVVSTRYGDVEVQVSLANGKVTAVQAISLPTGGRSGQISSYAAPVLASEALTAQSATIDIVSGATYTSQGYAQSLQAALDQAGITTTATTG
jgi:uncharacterized protein with FMN-binding domain